MSKLLYDGGTVDQRQSRSPEEEAALTKARKQREAVRFWLGVVIAAAGIGAVFVLEAVNVGFAVALVGAGLVPIEKLGEVFKR